MKPRVLLLWLGLSVGVPALPQSGFVTLEGKNFMLDGEVFYPVCVNFHVSFWRTEGVQTPTPSQIRFGIDASYGESGDWDCVDQSQCSALLVEAFMKVKEMGFNSVRLVGGITAPYRDASDIAPGQRRFMMEVGCEPAWAANCQRSFDLDLSEAHTPNTLTYRYFEMLQQVMDAADAADIKVIMLALGAHRPAEGSGTHYMYPSYDQQAVDDCTDFLSILAEKLADKPAFMAYDLFNEPHYNGIQFQECDICGAPGDWNQYAQWTKEDVCGFTSQWYSAIKSQAPQHMVTIGGAGWDDITVWDPAVMKVDFYSLHLYPTPDYLGNFDFENVWARYQGKLHWFGQNCPMPWIIGETSFSADERLEPPHTGTYPVHYQWPYMHGTEEEQATFIERSLEHTRAAGGSGWSMWVFQDLRWFSYQDGVPEPGQSRDLYFGILYLGATGDPWPEKPAADVFDNFIPGPYPETPGTLPANYYNPQNFTGPPWLTGTVTINGEPAKDVVVEFWSKSLINGTVDDYKLAQYRTFSDNTGSFVHREHPQLDDCALPEWDRLVLLEPGCKVIAYGWWDPAVFNEGDYALTQSPFELDGAVHDVSIPSDESEPLVQHHAWDDLEVADVTVSPAPDPGATNVEFVARQGVHVSSEFHAQQGSEVHLFLAEVFPPCDDPSFRSMQVENSSPGVTQLDERIALRSLKLNFISRPEPDIRIFPNPTTDWLTVEPTIQGAFIVRLTDSDGRLVRTQRSTSGPRLTCDVRGLAPGTYIVEVTQGTFNWTRTVVINSPRP